MASIIHSFTAGPATFQLPFLPLCPMESVEARVDRIARVHNVLRQPLKPLPIRQQRHPYFQSRPAHDEPLADIKRVIAVNRAEGRPLSLKGLELIAQSTNFGKEYSEAFRVSEALSRLTFSPVPHPTHPPRFVILKDGEGKTLTLVLERRSRPEAVALMEDQGYPDYEVSLARKTPSHGRKRDAFLARLPEGEILAHTLVGYTSEESPGVLDFYRGFKIAHDDPVKSVKGVSMALAAMVLEGWKPHWEHWDDLKSVGGDILPHVLKKFREGRYQGRQSPMSGQHALYPQWFPVIEAKFVISLFQFIPILPLIEEIYPN